MTHIVKLKNILLDLRKHDPSFIDNLILLLETSKDILIAEKIIDIIAESIVLVKDEKNRKKINEIKKELEWEKANEKSEQNKENSNLEALINSI